MKKHLSINWTFIFSAGIGLVLIPIGLVEAVGTHPTNITLDGTLPVVAPVLDPVLNDPNHVQNTPGGHIQVINENNGKHSGDNLFFSFKDFNIGSGDTAYFNLTQTWENVISRVTGGHISYIDGTLRVSGARLVGGNASNRPDYVDGITGATTIENGAKNFFFINPAGMVFGNGSVVDVPGSFYASTASSLKFADHHIFGIDGAGIKSELTSSMPVAFGFLGNETGKLNIEQGATIQVFNDETLALVGHDINIDGSTIGQVDLTKPEYIDNRAQSLGALIPYDPNDPNAVPPYIVDPNVNYHDNPSTSLPRFVAKGPLFIDGIQLLLLANHGKRDVGIFANDIERFHTAAMDQQVDQDGLDLTQLERAAMTKYNDDIAKSLNKLDGTINVKNTKLINAGGDSEEVTYLRGGDINLNNASVVSSNYGDDCAGLCASDRSSEPTPGPSGIDILATGKLSLNNGHIVTETTFSPVNPVDNVAINIQAASMLMDNKSTISTKSLNIVNIDKEYIPKGIVAIPHGLDPQAGDIKIKVGSAFVAKGGSSVESSTETFGDAGKITIDAGSITLNHASIKSESTSKTNGLTGYVMDHNQGWEGDIKRVSDGTTDGHNYTRTESYALLSEDPNRYDSLSHDVLDLTPDSLSMLLIDHNKPAGAAGSVLLTARSGDILLTNSIVSTNISSGTQDTAPGAITLAANSGSIIMNNSTVSSTSGDANGGDAKAGNINITFRDWLRMDPSVISTIAFNGNGGNIKIGGGDFITLQDSEITTSVLGMNGNGGNIDITSNYLVLDSGFIQANTFAQGGSGGLVNINVGTLLPSGNSLFVGGNTPFLFQPFSGINVIQAAAPSGLNGQINTTAPQLNLSGTLATLIVQSFDPASISRNLCAIGESSSLAQSGKGGLRRQAKDGLVSASF
jgi:large exoprotein involved in heme utilization and adhesion